MFGTKTYKFGKKKREKRSVDLLKYLAVILPPAQKRIAATYQHSKNFSIEAGNSTSLNL